MTTSMEWIPYLKLLVVVSIVTLTGCVSNPNLPVDENDWRVRGKFSFNTGEERESGNFDWQQSGNTYQVRMFGPLGLGAVQIFGNESEASIQSSRGQRQSNDPDQLIYEMTGIHLPITEIPDWLAGKPSTFHSENTILDADGNVSQTFIHGWQIVYEDYSIENRLPERLTATQGDAELKLVALDWQ